MRCITALLLGALGSCASPDQACHGGGCLLTIGGRTLQLTAPLFWTGSELGATAFVAQVVLSDVPALCDRIAHTNPCHARAASFPTDGSVLLITAPGAKPGLHAIAPADGRGAAATFRVIERGRTVFEDSAAGGWIRFTELSPSTAAGSMELDMSGGETIAIDFSAPACPSVNALYRQADAAAIEAQSGGSWYPVTDELTCYATATCLGVTRRIDCVTPDGTSPWTCQCHTPESVGSCVVARKGDIFVCGAIPAIIPADCCPLDF